MTRNTTATELTTEFLTLKLASGEEDRQTRKALTANEEKVLDEIQDWASVSDIADTMGVSEKTVKCYVTKIFRKYETVANEIANTVNSTYTNEERAERERLTHESIALGVDVVTIMMKAESTETDETETESAETETDSKPKSTFKSDCETLARIENGQESDEHKGQIVTNICVGVAHSVTRKLEQAGAIAPDTVQDSHKQTESGKSRQYMIQGFKRDIVQNYGVNGIGGDIKNRVDYLDGLYYWDYNENGDRVQKVVDGKDERTACALVSTRILDGSDLVSVCAVTLLEEIEKQRERGESIDLFAHYTVREISKQVRIKDSDNAWTDRDTCPIIECFRAVRRYIDEHAKTREQVANYNYILETETDDETGQTATIYKRLPHYYDLGSVQSKATGQGYTVEEYDTEKFDRIYNSLGLSTREKQIMHYRLQGHGNKAIARALGVSLSSIKTHMTRIKARAKDNEYLGDVIRYKLYHE